MTADNEKEQRDMIVQHFATERAELNSAIAKRDNLLEEMTKTNEKLNLDVSQYLENIKSCERKYQEEQDKREKTLKELNIATESVRALTLEKIVLEENLSDLELKLSSREKSKSENVNIANAKIKEMVKN